MTSGQETECTLFLQPRSPHGTVSCLKASIRSQPRLKQKILWCNRCIISNNNEVNNNEVNTVRKLEMANVFSETELVFVRNKRWTIKHSTATTATYISNIVISNTVGSHKQSYNKHVSLQTTISTGICHTSSCIQRSVSCICCRKQQFVKVLAATNKTMAFNEIPSMSTQRYTITHIYKMKLSIW